MKRFNQTHKAFSILELLILLCIIGIISFIMMKHFAGSLTNVDEPTAQAMKENKIDASSQQAILDSTTARIKELEQENIKRAEGFLEEVQRNY